MPQFTYKAKKPTAETVIGNVHADSYDEAVDLITQLGLLPVDVAEQGADGTAASQVASRPVRSRELYAFSRQMASLLKSGVPILQALSTLSKQIKNAYFSKVLDNIRIGIKSGRSFSHCLLDYPRIFSPFYIAMVHAGEESGEIREVMFQLAQYQRQQNELASKVRGALVYPVIMAVAGGATVIFILSYVMPKIATLFTDAGAELPLPTRILLSISHWLQEWWYVGLIAAFVLLLAGRALTKGGKLKIWLSNTALHLPWVGGFVVKLEMERFCRTLRMLLHSGVPIVQSIRIASATVYTESLKRELEYCQEKLSGGGSFGAALKEIDRVPDVVAQMIAVGEEAGSLDEALKDLTDEYAHDIQETLKGAMTLIEPTMIFTVGIVVGAIVLAMLLPIFQMDVLAW